eukprot:TRINITY_DN458_c0_g1_i1.p1 TRINITY_DN458_c0_g1~~TRINITY_DN458_c0_g1_i1.p1  ORF type:complete len:887 (+),score=285.08 TRINITY_DN458_c0_g1_i1:113-2773(+)
MDEPNTIRSSLSSSGKGFAALARYPSSNNLSLDSLIRKISSSDLNLSPAKSPSGDFDPSLRDRVFDMMTYTPSDVKTIERKIVDHVEYTLARDRGNFDKFSAFQAAAYSTKDRLIEFWNDTRFRMAATNPKRVYYLSIEYLLGRALQNSLLNLDVEENYKQALKELGFSLENLYEEELDAGLGNGGLGRLAACYLDSMATQNYPCWGYGLRYTYGMFKQDIFQGWQAETPDTWLKDGYPFEIARYDKKFPVRFYGEARNGHWTGGETVIAVAHDIPVPGFRTPNTINLRLWASTPSTEFDLASFNEGNYYKAVERRQAAEALSSVLYPNDNTPEGKELRFKQQYFFTSATIQDIIRRFKMYNTDFNTFGDKVGIQLNDTHPTLSILELLRILTDVEGIKPEEAYEITRKTFAYTNHTVLPEALEKWSVPLFERVLPRHLQIVYDINAFFLKEVERFFPHSPEILSKLSIIEEGHPKQVRMANLAIVMSHCVNGVAAIHTNILKNSLFKEFVTMYPEKFINITNGITPRRWLGACNRKLSRLIAKTLGGDEFLTDLTLLTKLREHADNKDLQVEWMQVKQQCKRKLADFLWNEHNLKVDPNALFDIQVKRIHEYKRQFLNILRVVHEYNELRRKVEYGESIKNAVPKVVIFGGKAAPGYHKAKLTIKLINSIAERINSDKTINGLIKVVFIPNYNVSLAELIVPASDISEHISTAGMEASGTSNMKFVLNGGAIIGTLDGANIEIRDAVGHENMFIFGLTEDKVQKMRDANRNEEVIKDPRLNDVVNTIRSGFFGPGDLFNDILATLKPAWDYYLVGEDFGSYLDAHQKVATAFQNKQLWAKMSILCTAGMGMFSSDRSVQEYAKKIWKVEPINYADTFNSSGVHLD